MSRGEKFHNFSTRRCFVGERQRRTRAVWRETFCLPIMSATAAAQLTHSTLPLCAKRLFFNQKQLHMFPPMGRTEIPSHTRGCAVPVSLEEFPLKTFRSHRTCRWYFRTIMACSLYFVKKDSDGTESDKYESKVSYNETWNHWTINFWVWQLWCAFFSKVKIAFLHTRGCR